MTHTKGHKSPGAGHDRGGHSATMRALTLIVLAFAALTACSSGRPAGCQTANPALIEAIASGQKDATLSQNGATLQSPDHENVWMVAVTLTGSDDAGVWATNDLTGKGTIYAVDGIARTFSTWGTSPQVEVTDEAAEQVRDCIGA